MGYSLCAAWWLGSYDLALSTCLLLFTFPYICLCLFKCGCLLKVWFILRQLTGSRRTDVNSSSSLPSLSVAFCRQRSRWLIYTKLWQSCLCPFYTVARFLVLELWHLAWRLAWRSTHMSEIQRPSVLLSKRQRQMSRGDLWIVLHISFQRD